jgi:hypothetical protein
MAAYDSFRRTVLPTRTASGQTTTTDAKHPDSRYRAMSPLRRHRCALRPARLLGVWALWALGAPAVCADAQDDPLPSWGPGAAKSAILEFVERVTREGGRDFVPLAQRIATFDDDGTLWPEQPLGVQLEFALDRVKALAPQHPDWSARQPFKAALERDSGTLAAAGGKGLAELLMATDTGTSSQEFAALAAEWMRAGRHPRFARPYTDLAYQPMQELLVFLRQNGFKTYIVCDGTVELMRPFAEGVFGVPPEQVIGPSFGTRFDLGAHGLPVLLREAKVELLDDGPGKPVAIDRFIGRRPILAFGNSDADLPMLQWTVTGPGPRMVALVRHTDAEREWAYDRRSAVGRLDEALDHARARAWVVVDMRKDWKVMYRWQAPPMEAPDGSGCRGADTSFRSNAPPGAEGGRRCQYVYQVLTE